MDIIEVAQQRSDSLIANLTALRQLSTVQLKEQSRETEEVEIAELIFSLV